MQNSLSSEDRLSGRFGSPERYCITRGGDMRLALLPSSPSLAFLFFERFRNKRVFSSKLCWEANS